MLSESSYAVGAFDAVDATRRTACSACLSCPGPNVTDARIWRPGDDLSTSEPSPASALPSYSVPTMCPLGKPVSRENTIFANVSTAILPELNSLFEGDAADPPTQMRIEMVAPSPSQSPARSVVMAEGPSPSYRSELVSIPEPHRNVHVTVARCPTAPNPHCVGATGGTGDGHSSPYFSWCISSSSSS